MEAHEIPIACRLDALTLQEQTREKELLREHLTSVRQIREREDGYSFQYPADSALFSRMAELVCLEHRCCPFLSFQLEWLSTEDAPWLHVIGGAHVKSFLADTFARQIRLEDVRGSSEDLDCSGTDGSCLILDTR